MTWKRDYFPTFLAKVASLNKERGVRIFGRPPPSLLFGTREYALRYQPSRKRPVNVPNTASGGGLCTYSRSPSDISSRERIKLLQFCKKPVIPHFQEINICQNKVKLKFWLNKRTSTWIGEQANIMLKNQKPLNLAKFDCFCHFYVAKKYFSAHLVVLLPRVYSNLPF